MKIKREDNLLNDLINYIVYEQGVRINKLVNHSVHGLTLEEMTNLTSFKVYLIEKLIWGWFTEPARYKKGAE